MSFFKFLIRFLSAFLFGFAIFYFSSKKIDLSGTSTPWSLITLLIFPFSYCIAAFFKVSEADEHTSLTDSELRRLRPIIVVKKRHLGFLIIFYLVAAFSGAIGMFTISRESIIYLYFISSCGGSIAASMYSFFFISSINSEIQRFKSILLHRAENNKKMKEFIESLNKKAD
ncbi:hypothetical protein ML023_000463 [Klebsiella pneumoniae]|uniref:hypothetical protein n=1 Tax=Klebsiella pneumoniae complex TaxID=3390273 RepID=UPI0011CC8BD9|nr:MULTISPECIES: hypothetical protein [Klebsiella]HBZ7345644.1 hypothetical protein [Klebsiella variicola subsp. variicola]EIX9371650.1 hypothetical protein [Klebsiella pneumoniae]MBX9271378.1 hypothetical protein [Klebsiella pneumoniae]MCK6047060.1 hypothetical protein [Klebsiella variicola]MXH34642.1 hypothetical protein [Klebsiella variicola]